MKTLILISILMFIVSIELNAQSDSIPSIGLTNEISAVAKDSVKLLPSRMMITQRVLWGEKGLMRNLDNFELNRF